MEAPDLELARAASEGLNDVACGICGAKRTVSVAHRSLQKRRWLDYPVLNDLAGGEPFPVFLPVVVDLHP